MPDILENAEAGPDAADAEPDRSALERVEGCRAADRRARTMKLERISAADAACTRIRQIPASGRSSRQRSSLRSATALPSARAASSQHGLDSCHDSTRPEARRSCSASASAATSTCARSSSMEHEQPCCASSEIESPIGAWLDALDARAPKNVVVVAMANKLARIAWAVLSSGDDYRPIAEQLSEKTPGLEALALPLYRTRRRLKFTHRGLHRNSKDERTVTTACLQPGTENGLQRPTDL